MAKRRTRLRVGVQLHPAHTTMDELRAAWIRLDDLGVDSLWTWDHVTPVYGPRGGNHFECWSLLAAMAATTRHVEIGPLVTPVAYRSPALLAEMARTVDHLSGGRLVLGLGAGWWPRDFTTLGIPMGSPGTRLAVLEDALATIRRQLDARSPTPVRRIPIMVAGGGERVTLRLAAEHADAWNGFGDPDFFRRRNAVLDDWCERVGRDAAEIERSVLFDSREWDGSGLDDYLDGGAEHFILGLSDPWNWDHVEALSEWARAVEGGALR